MAGVLAHQKVFVPEARVFKSPMILGESNWATAYDCPIRDEQFVTMQDARRLHALLDKTAGSIL